MAKSKAQKFYESNIPGVAAKVIDGDINLALKIIKRKLKNSQKIEILNERKEHKKRSVKRKEENMQRKFNARKYSRIND